MALRDREISLSYSHEIPHSVQFNPQWNKTSNSHSPVEVAKFLRIPQQGFTSSTHNSPYNKVYLSKRKFINTSTSQHEDLYSISSTIVRDLFSQSNNSVAD